jgi:hypothetical protein
MQDSGLSGKTGKRLAPTALRTFVMEFGAVRKLPVELLKFLLAARIDRAQQS